MNPPSQSGPGQTMSRRHSLFANACPCLGVMLDDREITIIGPGAYLQSRAAGPRTLPNDHAIDQ